MLSIGLPLIERPPIGSITHVYFQAVWISLETLPPSADSLDPNARGGGASFAHSSEDGESDGSRRRDSCF